MSLAWIFDHLWALPGVIVVIGSLYFGLRQIEASFNDAIRIAAKGDPEEEKRLLWHWSIWVLPTMVTFALGGTGLVYSKHHGQVDWRLAVLITVGVTACLLVTVPILRQIMLREHRLKELASDGYFVKWGRCLRLDPALSIVVGRTLGIVILSSSLFTTVFIAVFG